MLLPHPPLRRPRSRRPGYLRTQPRTKDGTLDPIPGAHHLALNLVGLSDPRVLEPHVLEQLPALLHLVHGDRLAFGRVGKRVQVHRLDAMLPAAEIPAAVMAVSLLAWAIFAAALALKFVLLRSLAYPLNGSKL